MCSPAVVLDGIVNRFLSMGHKFLWEVVNGLLLLSLLSWSSSFSLIYNSHFFGTRGQEIRFVIQVLGHDLPRVPKECNLSSAV